MSEERVLKMSEIFDADQIEVVTDLLNDKDTKGLKEYLRSIKDDLEKKEILSDYIFYVLCNNFNLKP